ncbi:MAG: SDR family oxidoreductase [Rhizobiales bacterium]|nr:SDR family oxidoreductase [Hyphomicrobiales bacterium]
MAKANDAAGLGARELFSLKGRTALVTGASSGLGRDFAAMLAANGARVVIAARRRERLEALAGEIEQAGGEALAAAMDVEDAASIAAAFDQAEARFGTVDVLINNAGTATDGPVLDIDMAEWRQVMSINLDAVLAVSQEAARRMADARTGGSIVNIASILGLEVKKGVAAYAVSKAGVVQLTKALALELARYKIRVNAIAPGYVETDMNRGYLQSEAGQQMISQFPQRRTGEARELCGAVLLLASDAGSYMTGSVIAADGGQSLVIP